MLWMHLLCDNMFFVRVKNHKLVVLYSNTGTYSLFG